MRDNIEKVLKIINKNPGVKGSMVMTREGIIISSDIGKEYKDDLISAISSSICLTLRNSLSAINQIEFSRYVITCTKGRLFLINLGKEAVLLILTNLNIDIEQMNIFLFDVTNMLKRSGRIDI
jgi:predicted regulator of Ras-like GTPase activity (Roadblock/LC7/MglB family)